MYTLSSMEITHSSLNLQRHQTIEKISATLKVPHQAEISY
jgi:hypothetical protein